MPTLRQVTHSLRLSQLAPRLQRWRQAAAVSPYWLVCQGAATTSWRLTAALVALTVLSALVPTALSLAMGAVIAGLPRPPADGLASPAGSQTTLALALLAALFVLHQFVVSIRSLAGNALGRRFQAEVQRRVMRASLRPRTVLHLEDPSLANTIRQSLGEGNMNSSGGPPRLAALVTERLSGAISLLVLARFSPWLALLLAAVWFHHLRRLQAVHRELISVRWRRTEPMRFAEYLGGVPLAASAAKEVRIFGAGGWFGEQHERAWLGAMAELWVRRRGLAPQMALATLPVLAVEAFALLFIGRAAATGEIGLGALVVYAHSVFQAHSFGAVSDSELAVQYSVSSLVPAAQLESAVATDPRLARTGSHSAAGLPREAIQFESVKFAYPGGAPGPVFHDLTLRIPAGRSLAIVGANGAGKTTLLKLLCRLYEPQAGRITADGIDLRELDARSWQRRFAAAFQDFTRFELTVYDNISLGALERRHDRELLHDAARRAGALDLIEHLPRGWDTVLSRRYSRGADLSGGQWQRIALARALFAAAAGAGILVMDEPTAQLDARAESAFFDSFLDLTAGLTTVVISHRFSTVRRAGRIAVLEGGAVAEDGSHDELMQLGGRYAHMFSLQAGRFLQEGAADPTGPTRGAEHRT